MFSLSLDTASLAELTKMQGFKVLLDAEIQEALIKAGRLLTDAAVANTWEVFAHPTGALASTIYPWLASPSEMEIRVDSPYARRREYGFSGMTDSLGRFYAHDPAKPYLGPALADNEEAVMQIINDAVQSTFEKIGVSF